MLYIKMRKLFSLCALLALSATPLLADQPIYARIGQTVIVDGPRVTPLSVISDSRCPANARCVWAGELRIRARITTGQGSKIQELTLGKSLPVADGTLELYDVQPARIVPGRIRPRQYRLGFRFIGGL